MATRRRVRQRKKGPVDRRLGERVRVFRKAEKMTQAQLAGTDFSKGFISLVETGRTRMSLRAAGIVAGRLGVPLSALLAEDDDSRGETGVEGALNSAIERTKELEDCAVRTRAELESALTAVRKVLATTPKTTR